VPSETESPRYPIRDCFTIINRGTVIAGDFDAARFRRGEVIEVVHGGRVTVTTCASVELLHGREADGSTVRRVGLIVPDIEKFAVENGDHVRRPAGSARAE
jgi:translation elongation factor EF-Tu-like GTPase